MYHEHFPNMTSEIIKFSWDSTVFSPLIVDLPSYKYFVVSFYVSPQTQQELAVDIEDFQEKIKALHSFVNQNGIAFNSF